MEGLENYLRQGRERKARSGDEDVLQKPQRGWCLNSAKIAGHVRADTWLGS